MKRHVKISNVSYVKSLHLDARKVLNLNLKTKIQEILVPMLKSLTIHSFIQKSKFNNLPIPISSISNVSEKKFRNINIKYDIWNDKRALEFNTNEVSYNEQEYQNV
ncbi:hypothetical protein H8356DRAFT_1324233 [Neocallimastix lanati (nom. inval.)]|nr:hypothetical protein H8356DRAFT_1324233 [Neocallimastix sp. JGI-2020a]